jgi:uncharacterized protein (UPF0332 family)
MSFDWNKYLALARTLSAATTDDASLRSAVSKSYYCAFNLAMSRALANSYRTPDDGSGSSHDHLWDLYGRNNNANCTRLAAIGQRMKRRRVKADYRANYDKLPEEVKDAIADAEECAAIISSLARELPVDVPRRYSF